MKYVEYRYRSDLGCTRLSPGTPAWGMFSVVNRLLMPSQAGTSLTLYAPIYALFKTHSGLSSVQSALLTCRSSLDFFFIVCFTYAQRQSCSPPNTYQRLMMSRSRSCRYAAVR